MELPPERELPPLVPPELRPGLDWPEAEVFAAGLVPVAVAREVDAVLA
ncbi:hypothetical protein [Serinibacter arcticus]|nr:hypothetical protein [Serinibacter arcticus]